MGGVETSPVCSLTTAYLFLIINQVATIQTMSITTKAKIVSKGLLIIDSLICTILFFMCFNFIYQIYVPCLIYATLFKTFFYSLHCLRM